MTVDRNLPALVAGGVDDDLARSWLTCVHASLRARPGSAEVLSGLEPPGPGCNHYSVLAGSPTGKRLRLLLNAAGRLVAASSDIGVPAGGPLEFVEVAHSQPFADGGFLVATAEELETPLSDEQVASLTRPQRADVHYHRATRVGDLVFNWFD